MTRELRPCRICGRVPAIVPYEQSIDGNHDRPARVVCRCGARHVLTYEQAGRRVMDKSSVTMTADDDWWLERVTMDGEQRYPERIRVVSLENPRVYVPERICVARIAKEEA